MRARMFLGADALSVEVPVRGHAAESNSERIVGIQTVPTGRAGWRRVCRSRYLLRGMRPRNVGGIRHISRVRSHDGSPFSAVRLPTDVDTEDDMAWQRMFDVPSASSTLPASAETIGLFHNGIGLNGIGLRELAYATRLAVRPPNSSITARPVSSVTKRPNARVVSARAAKLLPLTKAIGIAGGQTMSSYSPRSCAPPSGCRFPRHQGRPSLSGIRPDTCPEPRRPQRE